ncbi:MAG: hexose kinase [Armatimonadetes bacterium]|nr:hexose kinase [Armatimonadota bacterium]
MIVVLCANAGIDRTYEVDNFAVGHYHHPRHYRVAAGGKGINVARALRAFGARAVVTGFVGGLAAQFIQRQLLEAGLQPAFVPIGEESRVCINIIDVQSRAQTQVDEVGPLVTPSEVDVLRRRWPRLLAKANLAVISGSVPRGVPLDLYAELVELAHEAGKPVLLDARDDLLRRALPARPDLVKINIHELERVAGRPLIFPTGAREALKELVASGVGTAIVTAGRAGSLGVSAAGLELWAEPPEVPNLGAVGSGDAYLAGVAAAMAAGRGLEEQMRWGTAAGAANAMTLGACLFERTHVQECLPGVKVMSFAEAAGQQIQPAQGQMGLTAERSESSAEP